mgnify:CR=1 FL=1
MREYENQCVGCPTEIGCLGSSCPYINVPVYYCDWCESEGAEYRIDGMDYCETCVKKYLQEIFDDLTIAERAEALNIDLSKINQDK